MPPPPIPDADPAADPESRFLIGLWDCLEQAQALSVAPDALNQLDQILRACDAAAALVRAWQARPK